MLRFTIQAIKSANLSIFTALMIICCLGTNSNAQIKTSEVTVENREDTEIDGNLLINNNTGRLRINQVTNEAANNYVRSSLLFSRDGDLLWNSNTATWNLGSGGSNDFAAIMHGHNGELRFFTGKSNAFSSLSNTDFRNQFQRMIINGAGKVGIGTSPSSLLHVKQTAADGLQFERDGHDSYELMLHNSEGLVIKNVSDARNEMHFDGTGNVGIGTLNPSEKLEVAGKLVVGKSGDAGRLVLRRNDGNTAGFLGFPSSNLSHFEIGVTSGNSFITFSSNSGSGTQERMRIHSNGNIGVGTTSPTEKLQVGGNAKLTGTAPFLTLLDNAENSTWGFKIGVDGSRNHFITSPGRSLSITYGWDKNLIFGSSQNNNYNSNVIFAGGNVGISTSNPSYKLHVIGSTYSTTGWSSSDARWKQDIKFIEGASATLSKINPVSYVWDAAQFPDRGFDDKRHYGVIAQELEEILPELVSTDVEGYKSVEYNSLIAILVKAIQEKDQEIQDIKKQQMAQSEELQQLASSFAALQESVLSLLPQPKSISTHSINQSEK